MTSIINLSTEMIEDIVLKVEDVGDVISLGSTCSRLASIIGQERIWKILLAKTELVGEERVRRIAVFFTSIEDNDPLFSLLQSTIYIRHGTETPRRGIPMDHIIVSSTASTQLHSVSILGLKLLALATGGEATTSHRVHKVRVSRMDGPLVISLASLQLDQLNSMVTGEVSCGTEEQGLAVFSLLESYPSWRVDLLLSGGVGEITWGRLGSEVGRWLLVLRTSREVLLRARREDLAAFWSNSSRRVGLLVEGEQGIWKSEGANSWEKIEEMLE